MENDIREKIIAALESEIDFKDKGILRIIHNIKEKSKNNTDCDHLKKTSGLLTPPNYRCIPFSQCESCKEYFFSKNLIEEILKQFKNKLIHGIEFYK